MWANERSNTNDIQHNTAFSVADGQNKHSFLLVKVTTVIITIHIHHGYRGDLTVGFRGRKESRTEGNQEADGSIS